MKKIFKILILLIITKLSVLATTHTVSNSGFNFTPQTITITMGDDVEFVLGGSHNALEVSQSTWDADGNTPLPGFETAFGGGLVTAAELGLGTHWYVCDPHASLGMKGKIIVQNCTTPDMPAPIMGNTDVCSGSAETYSVTPVGGANSYIWSLPAGWSGSSTTESINTTTGSMGGSITVKAENACGESPEQSLSVVVTIKPDKPDPIDGETNICAFSTNTYSVNLVNGATEYIWTLPSGWTGSSSSESINTMASTMSGDIIVQAINLCEESEVQTLNISVVQIPGVPNVIDGNEVICAFSSNIYSVASVNGATSYTWQLPNGWTGSSTTESIMTTASDISGDITVTANNDCGSSVEQTLAITVNKLPETPGSISGENNICFNSTNPYSISPVNGATSYTWTLPNGWSGSSDTESIDATSNDQGGDITVIANNDCGSSTEQVLSIVVNIVNTDVSQEGAKLTADLSGGIYQWIDCEDDEHITGETDQVFTASTNGDYAVIITDHNCTDTSECYNVTSTNIENNNHLLSFNISPNPTDGSFRVKNNSIDKKTMIEVYNTEGKLIYQSLQLMSEIDMRKEQKGLYFVKLIQDDATITKKLILK